MSKNPLVVIVVIGVAAAGFFAAFFFFPRVVKEQIGIKTARITLPAGAEPTSPCFEEHGWHYATPEDLTKREGEPTFDWLGPTYVVWQPTGEVLAVEYMVSEEYLKTRPLRFRADIGRNYLLQIGEESDFPLQVGQESLIYQFSNISYSPGHAGFEVPHYDIHYYLISPERLASLSCPTAPAP